MFIFERLKVPHLMLAIVVFVVVPFITWYTTWFGRPLTDTQIAEYLHDEKARKVQHALLKISEKINLHDPGAAKFYPLVVQLAVSPVAEVRVNVAWVMGQDNHSDAFHQALLKMIADFDPLVRRNAALALVRFGDTAGHGEIIAMLRPYTLNSPRSGTMSFRLKVGDTVGRGTMLGHVGDFEVRSPLPGYFDAMLVKDDAKVIAGDPIASLSPGEDQVFEALRALYLIGTADDLGDVNRYARGVHDMSQRVQTQAELTAASIRKR